MDHVMQVTERVVVLRHGRKVGDLRTSATSAQEIVALITGSAAGEGASGAADV
jgi:ABC-type sugar transport system ATPase subunit